MNAILRFLFELLQRFVRTLDWILLGALLALMAIGLAVLHSAGNQTPALVLSQGARYGVGLGVMWLLSRVPLLRLRDAAPAAYVASLVPLVAVLFVGTGRSGAHWLDLGVFYFQPAELLKLSLPMAVAWYLNERESPPGFVTTVAGMLLVAVPTGLILLQPDFGTAMLVATSGAFVLYLAGMSWWWFVAAAGAVAAAAPAAWIWLLRPYQKDRVLTFLDPESDPLGAGWNIIQTQLAHGSGGLGGKGT